MVESLREVQMRPFTAIAVIGFTAIGLANGRAGSPPAKSPARGRVTLLGILAEWKYPGSRMLDGASMSDGGNAQVQSVKCQTILTSADPVEKVVAFYSKKLGITQSNGPRDAGSEVKVAEARSVSAQDDSQGRPLRLRVIVVNQAESSTTLVISRAEGEQETHIAWSHYLRLGGNR
jgi:hypothetical protein